MSDSRDGDDADRAARLSASDPVNSSESAAKLAHAVMAGEALRHQEQGDRDAAAVLPDDVLPGVGDEAMELNQAIRAGGASMVGFMFLLNVVDDLPRAVRVIAPDIQNTLGISDTTLMALLAFNGVALALGAVPIATMADRIKRTAIVPIASVLWAITMAVSGLVANAFHLFCTTALTGLGQSYRMPVANSLLADSYPVQARSQIFAFEGIGRPLGRLLGPVVVGGVATLAGGPEGWRWAFFALAIPPFLVGLASLRLKEPRRGAYDQQAIFGHTLDEDEAELPMPAGQAFARLKKVKTLSYLAVGVGVLGFALIAVPLQFNLLLEDRYAFSALKRGVVESFIWVLAIPMLPIVGRIFDRRFRREPAAMMRLAGYLVMASGVVYAIGLPIKAIGPLVFFVAVAQALIAASFVAAGPIISAVAPFRNRALAFALLPVSIFLIGGFFGGLVVGQLSDSLGNRTAMLLVAPPSAIVGGLMIVYGSRFIRQDISMAVGEMLEEKAELERLAAAGPAEIPVIQVRNLDFSYGPVHVLFDCDLDVKSGEVLALLGNNGAGKSTLLRCISGLGVPDRGVIRLNGRTITYSDAERRFKEGIVQLRGGDGIFPELSIADNLRTSVLASGLKPAEVDARIETAISRFAALHGRRNEIAGELSGGQQQMLALAMALMHEPEVLIIDELSLGLAPVIVQELLQVIEQLKNDGLTMIIVEQSINIALSVADKVVFMEKGAITFSGSASEMAERDDLAQAVFLGGH